MLSVYVFWKNVYLLLQSLNAVGGEGEAEILAPRLFHASCIGHKPFYHIPIHQRLAAEEVHLKVAAAAGVFHQEIQRPPSYLEAHHRPLTVVFTLAGEAVGAIEIAGVSHMEAKGLHHVPGAFLEGAGQGGKVIRRIELAGLYQCLNLPIAVLKLRFGHVRLCSIFSQHFPDNFFPGHVGIAGDYVVSHLVHHMDGAGAGVQHNIAAV